MVKVLVAQSRLTLCDPWPMWPTRVLCPWNSPGKNTGVGCYSLLQGIFPTHGLNLGLWSEPAGKPIYSIAASFLIINNNNMFFLHLKNLFILIDVYLFDNLTFDSIICILWAKKKFANSLWNHFIKVMFILHGPQLLWLEIYVQNYFKMVHKCEIYPLVLSTKYSHLLEKTKQKKL